MVLTENGESGDGTGAISQLAPPVLQAAAPGADVPQNNLDLDLDPSDLNAVMEVGAVVVKWEHDVVHWSDTSTEGTLDSSEGEFEF